MREGIAILSGELRDEWKGRVGALKADWMARIVPTSHHQDLDDIDSQDVEVEEGREEGEGMQPTIISDVDAREAMVERVDSQVNAEFEARLSEARERIRNRVERREELEVDLYLGSLVRFVFFSSFDSAGFNLMDVLRSFWKRGMRRMMKR